MKSFTQYTLRIYNKLNEELAKYRKEKMIAEESYPSMNEILIELIEKGLNGNTPEKIVSNEPEHTDSEQKKEEPDHGLSLDEKDYNFSYD